MRILLDTNILTRLAHPADPQHSLAIDATKKLRQSNELCIVPQNIYEFWTVVTRPTTVNGLGFTATQAEKEVASLKSLFRLLDDTPAIYLEWERLAISHAVVGKNVHDTRLVAAMVVHGILHLLTFNVKDFQRFTSITVLAPVGVVATSSP